jgi:hypothetical protein
MLTALLPRGLGLGLAIVAPLVPAAFSVNVFDLAHVDAGGSIP